MAAIPTPRLHMCQTPQQTAEVNAFDFNSWRHFQRHNRRPNISIESGRPCTALYFRAYQKLESGFSQLLTELGLQFRIMA